ncbi:MAG: S-adenosylmethionine:tRNA ribosyltransferase-isomerase, partial [Pseudobdellovibrionaceae bacterium]
STRVTETLARIPKDYGFQKDFASHHFKFSVHENQIFGETQIYLNKTSDFLWVNGILTNFHQPQTSLLVMICAFAGYDHVMSSYRHAVSSKFRLFSYGDFSVWNR